MRARKRKGKTTKLELAELLSLNLDSSWRSSATDRLDIDKIIGGRLNWFSREPADLT